MVKRRDVWVNPSLLPARRRAGAGYILIVALALMTILLLGLPQLLRLLKSESVQVTDQVNDRVARLAAETALAKGFAKISESSQTFTGALAGIIPQGYSEDVVYTEPAGGEYKIRLTSGPLAGQVTMVAKGRMPGGQTEAIKAVYERVSLTSAYSEMRSLGLVFSNFNSQVHWGPINGTNLTIVGPSPLRYAPRLKLTGSIYIDSGAEVDSNPAPPNTNGTNWWTFSSTDVQPMPILDFPYYRERSKNSVIPTTWGNGRIYRGTSGTTLATADPPGSGHFDMPTLGTIRITQTAYPGYRLFASTSVIFLDRYLGFGTTTYVDISSGTFLDLEALIVPNDPIRFSGSGSGVFGATIPAAAPLEYVSANGAAVWNAGSPSMASVYASPGRCCYPLTNVFVKGFLFGHTTGPGGIVNGAAVGLGSHGPLFDYWIQVYFDETVAAKVRLVNPPQRKSWERVRLPW